jgi:GDP-D-mannose 3', 5'-epimerase
MKQKKAIVLGAGGFIGGHLVKRLKEEGYWVRGVDIKNNEYQNYADEFILGDLTDPKVVESVIDEDVTELYQLAADMGGSFYIFTGENDANIMHDSALINLNVTRECVKKKVKRVFYSSSACIFPAYNQEDPNNPNCREDSAYPANPDSEYGWEKLFSERLYLAYNRNYKLDVRIARFHNIMGPKGTWRGGREKAPAALCRKVIEAPENGTIEIWGPGTQTRSFLYIDECVEGVRRLMNSNFLGPVNIGSEEMISINDYAKMIIDISGKKVNIVNVKGPVGVNGRNSDNTLIREKLNWAPSASLREGTIKTYNWIKEQVEKNAKHQ